MKAPKKVITAMAMAALLGGTAVQAFADDFTTSSGENGQNPLKTYSKKVDKLQPDSLKAQGDIEVNGEFTRQVDNFPVPTEDGHYLRVTMPIELDYTYNLDTDVMVSAKGEVTNESVYVEDINDTNPTVEGKAVNMSFVSLGVTSNQYNMEYVKNVDNSNQNVQLPFQVVVTKDGENVGQIPLESIKNGNEKLNTIEVKPDTKLQLEIGRIGSQNVVDNAGVLDGQTAKIGHKMTMKFEYLG